MIKLFEQSSSDEANIKDGGFIFQAILNYDLKWSIVDGHVNIDQNNINGYLNQVDIFPDMKFIEGHATLAYVTLSEVNLLKRKFDLASEAIKRIINPAYAQEMAGEISTVPPSQDTPQPATGDISQSEQVNEVVYTTKLTSAQIKEINDKYFNGSIINIRLMANDIVLREVSTSGIDSGNPSITLKLSTGMVDTLDGKAINSWNNIKVNIDGPTGSFIITNESNPKISEILVYDSVDNTNELIFRTILPSVSLDFRGDKVSIDKYSNRSTEVSVRSTIDFDNLFNIEEAPKQVDEPIEGEDLDSTGSNDLDTLNRNK